MLHADKMKIGNPLRHIIVVGPHPPPTYGLAEINRLMGLMLEREGFAVVRCDTAAPSLSRTFRGRAGRLPRLVRALVRFLRFLRVEGAVYLSLSGGLGQTFECLVIGLARLYRRQIVIHHHNYTYIDRSSVLARLVFLVSGKGARHIALSEKMGLSLKSKYPSVGTVITVSNAAFMADLGAAPPLRNGRVACIGFLANICEEKGVFEYLDLCAGLCAEGVGVRCLLAGPFQDEATQQRVMEMVGRISNIEYVGPKYGDEKTAFFQGLDILAFPTKYANEAEPLVIHEALGAGVPVVAWGRGAIPEVVDESCGFVVPADASFVDHASMKIREWIRDPSWRVQARGGALRRFALLRSAGQTSLKRIVEGL